MASGPVAAGAVSLSCRLGSDRSELAVDAPDPWGRRLVDLPVTASTRSALLWDPLLCRAALTEVDEPALGEELTAFRARGGAAILNLTGAATTPSVARAATAAGVAIVPTVPADRAADPGAVPLVVLPHAGRDDVGPAPDVVARLAGGSGPVVVASDLPIPVPVAAVDRLIGGGVAPDRLVVTGIGVTDEFTAVRDLLRRGVTCVVDGFGAELRWHRLGLPPGPREPALARWIVDLFGMGLGAGLALGHGSWTSLDRAVHGGTGLGHLLRQVPRRLRDRGLTAGQLDQLLRENPTRILADVPGATG